MDLRTIMNNDGSGAKANAPPPNQSSSPPSAPPKKQRTQSAYPDYPARPPQPPLQHAQHASPERSSPYAPAQSPYQKFNAGPHPINTVVQAQRSQSPTHVSTPYGPGARDPYGAAYNSHPQHPANPLASPYTPQQPMSAGPQQSEPSSYFAQQRSHSLHNIMTNQGPLARDSPPSAAQPLPPHQFSPTQRPLTGTPLRPPPQFATRQSPSSARPQSSGHESPRNPLSSPQQAHDIKVRDSTQVPSPSRQRQISPGSRQPETSAQAGIVVGMQQASSEVASPKMSRRTSAATDSAGAARPPSSNDNKWNESPTAPLHSGPGSDSHGSPSAATHQQLFNSSPSAPRGSSHPLKMEIDSEPSQRVSSQPPKPKRRRYNEPPIYAQRIVRTKGRLPIIPNPNPPIPKHARPSGDDYWANRRASSVAAPPVTMTTPSSAAARTPSAVPPPSSNGPAAPSPVAVAVAGKSQPGLLGPWEPSITGVIPHEEVTKLLCDFLFQNVVLRTDVAAGPAGSAAAGQGAIIEVEAKLGHVIDMDRQERLSLPVLTETVVNRDIPRFRTSFESSMTVVSTHPLLI